MESLGFISFKIERTHNNNYIYTLQELNKYCTRTFYNSPAEPVNIWLSQMFHYGLESKGPGNHPCGTPGDLLEHEQVERATPVWFPKSTSASNSMLREYHIICNLILSFSEFTKLNSADFEDNVCLSLWILRQHQQ